MMMKVSLLFLASAAWVQCQRPPYAGSRPIGYPAVTMTTTPGLVDRFGEGNGTTPTLPIEAMGDRELVDRLSKLPIDKQPFWLINWQALEANRQKPQTYPQKPNTFIDPLLNTGNTNVGNVPNSGNIGTPNSGNVGIPNSGIFGVPNSGNVGIPNSGNRGNALSTNSGSLNSGSSFTVPNSNFNTPIANTNLSNRGSIPNANSANENVAIPVSASNFGSIADRFSGGIEPNRYFEN